MLTLAIGYPMAYTIAFRGGRLKNALLLLVVLPFFVSFVIRTLSWRMILSDNGHRLRHAEGPAACSTRLPLPGHAGIGDRGLTYNFLPFMILPLYVAIEKIDRAPDRGGHGPVRQPPPGIPARHAPALAARACSPASLLTLHPGGRRLHQRRDHRAGNAKMT